MPRASLECQDCIDREAPAPPDTKKLAGDMQALIAKYAKGNVEWPPRQGKEEAMRDSSRALKEVPGGGDRCRRGLPQIQKSGRRAQEAVLA